MSNNEWVDLRAALSWLETRDPFLIEHSELPRLATHLTDLSFEVLAIDGSRTRSESEFLDVAGECLRFPSYYGHNWNAFFDSLGDLPSSFGGRVAILWMNADILWKESWIEGFRVTHRVLERCAELSAWRKDMQQQVEFILVGSEEFVAGRL